MMVFETPPESIMNATRFSLPLIMLHWLTVIAVVMAYLTQEMELFEDSLGGEQWHYLFGLLILISVLPRLIIRLLSPTPPIIPAMSSPMLWVARLTHLALYSFLILMPLAGWLLLNAEGETLTWQGITLPNLIAPNEQWAEWLEELHEAGASAGYLLIGLHSGAALLHHVLLKDNTLRRMLPWTRRTAD